jgi:PTS system ascorbate-specific IIA component
VVGILVIAHNGLGDSLLDCVRHVIGETPAHLKALSILADDDLLLKEAEGRRLISHLDDGEGVLILTDVYGATPSNIARRLCKPGHIEGVAGVNLPMLLRVSTSSSKTLKEMVQRALEGGKECIVTLDSKGNDVAT